MKKEKIILVVIGFLLSLNIASAAHYIVGYVENASDGTPANNQSVVLWNPVNGINDNLTDIIGPNGNSGSDNTYMIDCELLDSPCNIGDEIFVRVYDTGEGYVSENNSIVVTGAGYDVANLSLNSPPRIESVIIEDNILTPQKEIDLLPASTKEIRCRASVSDETEESLLYASAEFFNSSSFYGDTDDNNYHYTNSSCILNKSYGNNQQAEILCSFELEYYSSPGEWNCTIKAYDNLSTSSNKTNKTKVNELLSIGVQDFLDYGTLDGGAVSEELQIDITNYGNVPVNLSLSGYAIEEEDGLAMRCEQGSEKNISIDYEKYNLTNSNTGNIGFNEFDALYSNLSSQPVVKEFNLPLGQKILQIML